MKGLGVTKELKVLGKFKCKLPNFPESYIGQSLIKNNTNELLVLGGFLFPNQDPNLDCLIYRKNKWSFHSKLEEPKLFSCAISMPEGVYVFGEKTYPLPPFENVSSIEFLANHEFKWKKLSTTFPGFGLRHGGRGVAISMNEILFTGGTDCESRFRRIVKLDTHTMTWSSFGNLIHGRNSHSSFAFGENVIVCGGWSYDDEVITASTEIISLHTKKIKQAGNLIEARCDHGMGIMKIGNTKKLVAFGGIDAKKNLLSSVESWNEHDLSWEMTNIRMPQCSGIFSYWSSKDL